MGADSKPAVSGRESRVSVDLDAPEARPIQAIRAYHALQQAAERVDVRISASGTGLHLVGFFAQRLTDDQKERLRRDLGDDVKRIELDTLRRRHGQMTQVLWTEKNGRSVDTDYDDIYAALDHIALGGG